MIYSRSKQGIKNPMFGKLGKYNPNFGKKIKHPPFSKAHLESLLFAANKPELKEYRSEFMKKKFLDSEWVAFWRKAIKVSPNQSEKKLFSFLSENFRNDCFQFVGDFSMGIGGKYPDFINENKKIIELFGKYWHDTLIRKKNLSVDEHCNGRIKHFKDFGYDTLIIWDYELSNKESLTEKIQDFTHHVSC